MSTGYECRTCGHVPSQADLNNGSCPRCAPARATARESLPDKLEKLPLGSSLLVFQEDQYGRRGEHARVVFLWTSVGRSPDGKTLWKSAQGKTEFRDLKGDLHVAHVERYADHPFHDPLQMTAEAVAHFTLGEVTYRAWYVIHNIAQEPE